ncbi:MAG TPA: tannase/feruloyl esterase family alpha/beta hydrolase [Terriglobales bacterium]|nr:tannase/feruloyl esterase family alpha/beta hydrolase [Terriglobales bacterium]
MPGYCRVTGYVAPQVGFELRLPSSWNGKFLSVGSGGWGGVIDAESCNRHLKRGYACIVSDTGHSSRGVDGLWALNNLPAQVDFAYRAIHVSALAGKAIAAQFYSRAPRKSYFFGCSTGGHEGLVEAQKFPWDFDGIVAGAPDMDEAEWVVHHLWLSRNFLDAQRQPVLSSESLKLLHEAALAACDLDDGVGDGIISDPLHCHVDLQRMVCGVDRRPGCLTESQMERVRNIYAGPPPSATGAAAIRGPLPGSELFWGDRFLGLTALGASYAENFFRYMIYGISPELSPSSFDFYRDYRRLGMAALYTATNPDLRRFKAAGGKLLAYQGGIDTMEDPEAIVDYYETTERTMGGRGPTQNFFRLFIVPGMQHCGGGTGPYAIDYMSYIESWVEEGKPPDQLIGAHINDGYMMTLPIPAAATEKVSAETRIVAAVQNLVFPLDSHIPIDFTRPVFPYPLYSKYSGIGDTHYAASFGPSDPTTISVAQGQLQ